jgi:hypothetical protein
VLNSTEFTISRDRIKPAKEFSTMTNMGCSTLWDKDRQLTSTVCAKNGKER